MALYKTRLNGLMELKNNFEVKICVFVYYAFYVYMCSNNEYLQGAELVLNYWFISLCDYKTDKT